MGQRLSAGSVVNASFELYRRQARAAWAIAALIAVPAQALVWIMTRASLSGDAFARGGVIYTSSSSAFPTVAIGLLGFLSAVLTMGALSRLLVEAYTGHHTSWQESLGYASGRLVALIVLAVVSGVLLFIGYLLFLVPGLFLTVMWCAAVPVLMFEPVGPLPSLRRSSELVRGDWWATAGTLLIGLLIVFGISFLVGLIFNAAISTSSVDLVLTLGAISRALAAILAYPFLAAMVVVIYVNLRAQKEGLTPQDLVPDSAPGRPFGS